jgi:ABC-type multidrug transport system permease subunit
MTLVIMWERWEGTIEHTLMAPVSRVVHLLSMGIFAVVHGAIRVSVIPCCSLPFFAVNLSRTDLPLVLITVLLGSVSLVGLGIATSIMPMLYPERGEQLSFMDQALVLLVSGVYYGIGVLPGWLQPVAHVSRRPTCCAEFERRSSTGPDFGLNSAPSACSRSSARSWCLDRSARSLRRSDGPSEPDG